MARTTGKDHCERKVIDDIAQFGWHCVHIIAEGSKGPYSFTVGLFETYRHPELIIFGLPSKVAHQILCIAADQAKCGNPIDLSQPTSALLNDYSCCFAEVSNTHYDNYVGYCIWYYEGKTFPLHQVIWPSRARLYPWHPEASVEFRETQPVIAESASQTH